MVRSANIHQRSQLGNIFRNYKSCKGEKWVFRTMIGTWLKGIMQRQIKQTCKRLNQSLPYRIRQVYIAAY